VRVRQTGGSVLRNNCASVTDRAPACAVPAAAKIPPASRIFWGYREGAESLGLNRRRRVDESKVRFGFRQLKGEMMREGVYPGAFWRKLLRRAGAFCLGHRAAALAPVRFVSPWLTRMGDVPSGRAWASQQIERATGSMTSGPAVLKIDWFETHKPSPGFDRLAPPRPRARIKNAVSSKEQKGCCSNDTKSAAARSFPIGLQPQLSSSIHAGGFLHRAREADRRQCSPMRGSIVWPPH
jgi:hypothetical protein